MQKVLFFSEKEKSDLIAYLKKQLEIKNRLLGLIITNPDRKTGRIESSKKAFKYEQQIMILQNMLNQAMTTRTREDIRNLNEMMDVYNSLEK